MTDQDPGTDLVPVPPQEGENLDPQGPYAVVRLEVSTMLEHLCGSKLEALEVLSRLESALWAAVLLDAVDAEHARPAFGLGLGAFVRDLEEPAPPRRTRKR